jgi:pyrroloquinoline quinone (PQQ) biosynthesis protein C
VKIVDVKTIVASATPAELLREDETAPNMRLADHPVWRSALAGELAADRLRDLVTRVYPVIGGPGRYAFIAKIGVIDREDGARLFDRLYHVTHDANSDADAGWGRLAEALGASAAKLAAVLDDPSPEARDLVDTIRLHGEQSGAAQAAGVAWVLERQLPTLMGALADALRDHYGIAEDALTYLRAEAARAGEVETWVTHLIDKYFMTADAFTVYEARRAMREAGWGWTALTEAE